MNKNLTVDVSSSCKLQTSISYVMIPCNDISDRYSLRVDPDLHLI